MMHRLAGNRQYDIIEQGGVSIATVHFQTSSQRLNSSFYLHHLQDSFFIERILQLESLWVLTAHLGT